MAGWGLGVWGSVAGSIGLLMRRRWSSWAFVVSILGLAISSTYNFFITNGIEIMGTGGAIFTCVIWLVAILLLVYARRQCQQGVLR